VEPLPSTGDEECPVSTAPPGVATSDSKASILHDPQIGIDFVLALERPCLPHLRETHLDHVIETEEGTVHTDVTSGHLFTASLSLWRPTNPSRSNRESYAVSAAELDRLLQYSLNIPVDSNEITPVQIWQRLKTFSVPPDVQVDLLANLAEELIQHVKCLHFGAVIENDTLNFTLGRLFGPFSAAK